MAGGRERSRAASSSSASASSSSSSLAPPVRVYPPSASASRALQALPSDSTGVAAVGILSNGRSSAAAAFANRLIGRRAFHEDALDDAARRQPHASIHLFYDASRCVVYLLGLARPTETPGGPPPTAGEALEPPGAAEAERERLKMQTLLLASCSLVFLVQRGARATTHELKRVRALAAEKAQLVHWLRAPSGPTGGGKRPPTPSPSQVFAPGRCVPAAVFVIPAASDVMLGATVRARPGSAPQGPSSSATRSATATHCRAVETRLMALFRSLRGGPVGSARMRDALTAANLSKERRVFTMDPSHSVVVVSRRAADGPDKRMRDVLDALSDSETESEAEDADEELLAPLEDDDVGWPRALHYQQRLLDHLRASQAAGGGAKDASGVMMELLPLPQWLRAFQALVKLYQRMDGKRRSEAAAASASMAAVGSGDVE